MSKRIHQFVVAAAAVAAVGLLSAASAPAAVTIPVPPSVMNWPFTCDPARHQFVIDAGDNYAMGAKLMCGGKGVLTGPGWWHRGWPGLVDGGAHYMSVYDAPQPPDAGTKAEWFPTITVPGMYDVWVSYRTTHNRADDAPYYLYADDGVERVAHVNQKGGAGEDGFRANYLGNYYFKRHAMDKAVVRLQNDEGTHSKGADGLFMKYTGPQNVKGLTASNATATDSITLKWQAVAGATKYAIYRSRTNNVANALRVKLVTAPTRTYVDTPINEGKTWYYWVKAIGAMNIYSKGFSNGAAGKTGRTPAVPVMDDTPAVVDNTIKIQWGAVAGATSYQVYRGSQADGSDAAPHILVAAPGVEYTDIDLAWDTQYCYSVAAKNAIAESVKSATVCGTTGVDPTPVLAGQ